MDRRRLGDVLRGTLQAERAPAGELSLTLIGDHSMRRLNRDFRGIDRTTDVLSFSYIGEPHAGGVLGELFVSPVVARRQAKEAGCPFPDEIARLCVHGALHILGYDHGTATERRAMFRRQDRYLQRFLRGAVE